MNSLSILKIFRKTALALAFTASTQVFAATVVDQVIAVVDSSVILKSELDTATAVTKAQFEQREQPVPPQEVLRKQVLDQLILRQAQIEQVKKYGLRTDENQLNNAVLSIAKQQGMESLSEFQQKLDQRQAGSYQMLRAQVADDMNVSRLRQQQVMSRIQISERDVDNFLKTPQGQAALGIQAHIVHMRISPKADDVAPKELQEVAKAVKQALITTDNADEIVAKLATDRVAIAGADMGSRALKDIPADIAARLGGLAPGQTTELINANDGVHVLKLLNRASTEKKALVTQYFTRHILIQPSEVVSPDDAKQHIEQLYQRIQKGADFNELASTFSTDPGSARDGGSLGWVSAGVMVPEFENVMKKTAKGQVSQPFETQYGWHILKVEDTRENDMTEEYQRRMAKQLLGERQFDTEVDSWLREVRANAYVDIKDPTLKDQ